MIDHKICLFRNHGELNIQGYYIKYNFLKNCFQYCIKRSFVISTLYNFLFYLARVIL